MKTIVLQGRKIVQGFARGIALVTREPVSFMGSIDPRTGIVIERGHELQGQSLKDRIFVFPFSKGSTGGSYMLFEVVHNGVGPAGIINSEAESITVIGAIVAALPMVDRIDLSQISTGDMVEMDAGAGIVRVVRP